MQRIAAMTATSSPAGNLCITRASDFPRDSRKQRNPGAIKYVQVGRVKLRGLKVINYEMGMVELTGIEPVTS